MSKAFMRMLDMHPQSSDICKPFDVGAVLLLAVHPFVRSCLESLPATCVANVKGMWFGDFRGRTDVGEAN